MLLVWPINIISLDLIGHLGSIAMYMLNIYISSKFKYTQTYYHYILFLLTKDPALHFLWCVLSMSLEFAPTGTSTV